MNFRKNLYWLVYPLFMLACAQTTTPTGGPKDTIPPTLDESYPRKGQTQFKESRIELTFDEAVVLNNPKDQILITPDINKKYDISAKRNKVSISLETPLSDSTTYSINFRESIQDITEKNPAENLKLAFSTGTYIDSLSIKGTVYDLMKNTEIKDATIALYSTDTFNIFKHRPTYFTKANDKGSYVIENIKNGLYKIYAFEDKNRNLVVDSKSENYGFLKDTLILNENKTNVNLTTIRLDARPVKITSARPYNTYYNIKFSKGINTYSISSNDRATIYSILTPDKALIKIYNQNLNADSTLIHLKVTDSIGQKIDTTLYAKFLQKTPTKEKAEWKTERLRLLADKGIIAAEITSNKPIAFINFDSINFKIDSANNILFTPADISYDTSTNTLTINKKVDKTLFTTTNIQTTSQPAPIRKTNTPKTEKTNTLQFGRGAFITIENDSIPNTETKIKPTRTEDTGILMFNINTNEQYFIAELLNKNFDVIQRKINQKKLVFEDLEPGDYQLRIIIDRDKNGVWSPGSFYSNEPPEKIIYYLNDKKQKIVNMKANWELGPLLINF